MKIGVIIGRFGDIDGVSLETQKWIDVLRNMGHEIFILTGRLVDNELNKDLHCTVLKPLSFFSPECEWEQKRAFYYPDDTSEQLIDHLNETAASLANDMFHWIVKNNLKFLISENASALPCHLSMGMAIKKIAENTNLPIITHDHDFYWERGDRYKTPFSDIGEIIKSTFPLHNDNVKHAVINTYSQTMLKDKLGVHSVVVPNVMDFSKNYGALDAYNKDFKSSFGWTDDDIILGQITRIVRRKGIETAIELVARLDDPRVKLLITGSKADDDRLGYYRELVELVEKNNLQKQVQFGEYHIRHFRESGERINTQKVYSLSDAYAHSTAATYFSTYEGFGNAFIECVLAKKPIFVNNYEPIYWSDIGSKGFETVQIEDSNLTDDHVAAIRDIITNPKRCKEICEHNFELGKKHFSYEVLEEKLTELIEEFK